jgi:dTDP-4-amino-4,6-dideoxygalactose transaminase
MGIGNDLIGDLERLLTGQTLHCRALFRMTGKASQCWRAEQELQRMYPGMRCLLLPSASIGLSLLFEVLDLQPGQEILTAPFGWLSNWSCIRRAGLIPRFLPLDDCLQLRTEDVADRITDLTGAVLVTHLMGRGQQAVENIGRICGQRGIPLLEDIAQSFGVLIGGRRAGTFGAAAWCSLNHHKVLSTGDGGFVAVRDARLFAELSARHDQGCVLEDGKRRPAENPEPGLSLRVSELVAAVLRAQLARYHLIRARILALHRAVSEACKAALNRTLIAAHEGDLPFTVLVRLWPEDKYPPLAHSGWHVAANVSWLARAVEDASREDPAVAAVKGYLAATAAIGSGFVDPYYAVPAGLSITDSPAEAPRLVNALKEML